MFCSRWLRYKDDIFLAHFRFLKKLQIFLMLAGHHACSSTSTKISIDILLPAPKTFGLKIIVACFTNWFQSILLLVGRGCILSISPFRPLHTYPHKVVKGPHCEAWTRSEPEVTSSNPARAHLFLKLDLGLKAKLTEGVKICATAE